MEAVYIVIFVFLAVLAVLLEFRCKLKKDRLGFSPAFTSFRNGYLVVYCLMMAGDWLQGPYVYALYEHYHFSVGDIGRLFIAGFGSSMLFGTVVGALADHYGRKTAALIYVATYMLSCVTKHFASFEVLLIGRLLGGIATSLLFSAFEAWVVSEHLKRGFEEAWLGNLFSMAVFLGNGLTAIFAGLLANTLVEYFALGPVAPFDAAFTVLLVGGVIIYTTWPENHGDNAAGTHIVAHFKKACSVIASEPTIALLGAMQSLFEASMYTFVFLWTPALSPAGEHIPHGFIFALFMVACMVGSAIAGMLLGWDVKLEKFMPWVFAIGSLTFLVPAYFHTNLNTGALAGAKASGITQEGILQLLAFCVFEIVVGVFWPSMMAWRAHHLPEELRATIINCFRVPLNIFVCAVLYNVSKYPLSAMFGLCSIMLMIACLCAVQLQQIVRRTDKVEDDTQKILLDA